MEPTFTSRLIELFRMRRRRRHCVHRSLEGIYGDMIIAVGGYRLRCTECRALLDGPVELAARRNGVV